MVLIFVVLLAYIVALRPMRVSFASKIAWPVLQSIETERAQEVRLERVAPTYITAYHPDFRLQGTSERYTAPAGLLFLLAAGVLVLLFPQKLYWLWFLLYHFVVGSFALFAFAIGVGWGSWGFMLSHFLQTFFLELTSLALPAILVAMRLRENGEGNVTTSVDVTTLEGN